MICYLFRQAFKDFNERIFIDFLSCARSRIMTLSRTTFRSMRFCYCFLHRWSIIIPKVTTAKNLSPIQNAFLWSFIGLKDSIKLLFYWFFILSRKARYFFVDFFSFFGVGLKAEMAPIRFSCLCVFIIFRLAINMGSQPDGLHCRMHRQYIRQRGKTPSHQVSWVWN